MMIIGHRGARGEAPENTLVGFEHLRALGIQAVELDIQLSQDQALMVIHDPSIDRTCNGTGKVNEWPASKLAQLDATRCFANWKTPSGVPRLDDVLAKWPYLEHIQIEVKTAEDAALMQVISGLKTLLDKYKQQPTEFVITSSDTRLLALAKTYLPTIKRGFVAQRFCRNPIAVCASFHCSHLVINQHRCSYAMVLNAQAAGLQVSCWTVNEPNRAKELMQWGVDSLITDVPQTMLKALYHETLHHAPG